MCMLCLPNLCFVVGYSLPLEYFLILVPQTLTIQFGTCMPTNTEARSYFYTQGPAKDQFRKELNRAAGQRELQVSECVHMRDTKLDRSAEYPAINVQRCHQDTRSEILMVTRFPFG